MIRKLLTVKNFIFFIIGAFSLFLFFNWHKEPVDSYRLKIQSFFSKEAEFEVYMRNFKKELGHNKYARIDYCSMANKKYRNEDSFTLYDSYINTLAKYAKLNVDKAKRELLWLANYERKDYPCPEENDINFGAKSKIKYIFGDNLYNLINWIPKDSNYFKNQDKSLDDNYTYIMPGRDFTYKNYLIDIAIFHYRNNRSDLTREIIDKMISDSNNYIFIFYLEKKLSTPGNYVASYDLLNLYRYLINHVDKSEENLKKYYTYRISEAILRKDKYNIEARNTILDLANQGYGYAIYYLYQNSTLSSEENKNLFLKLKPENYDSGSISALYRLYYYGLNTEKDIFGDSILEKLTKQACERTKNEDCDTLLGRIYIENKKYDKAKEKYESLFDNFNPTKYGKSDIGIEASKALGNIYYQGLGIRQDLEKAKYYYGVACDYNDQDSCALYKEVNEKIR